MSHEVTFTVPKAAVAPSIHATITETPFGPCKVTSTEALASGVSALISLSVSILLLERKGPFKESLAAFQKVFPAFELLVTPEKYVEHVGGISPLRLVVTLRDLDGLRGKEGGWRKHADRLVLRRTGAECLKLAEVATWCLSHVITMQTKGLLALTPKPPPVPLRMNSKFSPWAGTEFYVKAKG